MRTITLCCLILFAVSKGEAQLTAFRNTVPDAYNFWLYNPSPPSGDTIQEPLPVLIFLHGRSLSGSNMERVRRYGIIDALEKGRQIDAIVVAPQCPSNTSWRPDRVANLLDWVQQNYHTDTNRVYVAGMSLGGYGTMDFAGTYPERVAAAAALCGGGTEALACNLAQIPLWIMHGTHDRHVTIAQSEKMVRAITACGDTSRLRFTPLQGMNHADLARVFYTQQLYDWLFMHCKSDTTQHVDKTIEITPQTLRTVYTDLSTRGGAITVDNTAAASPSGSQSNSPEYYTIRRGDTLGHIARRHNTTVRKLCQLNGISETTILQIGQRIRVR
jgi:LysM repeat protein